MEKPKGQKGGKREGAGRKKAADANAPAKTIEPTPKTPTEAKKASRGIVIIALGNPQYGKMAANLAASIRYSDREVNIHLVYSGVSISHLTDKHKNLFTSMAECPEQLMTKNGKANYVMPKACIYELSPYDETLMIDADMIWFAQKKASAFMEDLSAVDFAIQSRGFTNLDTGTTEGKYTHWIDVEQAQEAYGIKGIFYKMSSEVVWFKKSAATKKLFAKIKQIFINPKVKPSIDFAGDLPDEYAYNIACNLLGFEPRKPNEVFVFWNFLDNRRTPWNEIISNYYGYSLGGNNLEKSTIEKYTQMAKAHANALGLPYHFQIHAKNKWDSTRKEL